MNQSIHSRPFISCICARSGQKQTCLQGCQGQDVGFSRIMGPASLHSAWSVMFVLQGLDFSNF